MNKRFASVRVIVALSLLLAGVAQAQRVQPEPKFLRFVPDKNGGGVLQTSIVTYQNAAGKRVDLIGAVHIADQRYFQDLNKTFEDYDSLLYELVKPKDVVPGRGGVAAVRGKGERPLEWVGMIQEMLKSALDLSFQLDEIDYTKRNMVHADLDTETFMQMQADRGESFLMLMIQQMIHEMGRADAGANVNGMDVAGLIMALQAPDSARQLKLVLARQFNQMEDMMSGFGGPNGTVIVTERNRAALTMLRKRLEAGDKKIGVFYGAAHLKEMEKDLTGLMGFKQVGEPKWLTAWDMTGTAAAAGVARPSTRPTTRPLDRQLTR